MSSKTACLPAISDLKFPFVIKKDQLEAIDAWLENGSRISVVYSRGTGKTEIAFECARRAAGLLNSGLIEYCILYQELD